MGFFRNFLSSRWQFAGSILGMTAMPQSAQSVAEALTRRRLLQIGGIGLLGLGLPQLLRAAATGSLRRAAPEKSCIFIVQYGGASHIDSWDLKTNAPDEM